MSLKPYKTTVNGVETTLMLNDEDAKKRGLVEEKKAPAPANKARGAKNKAS